MTTQGYAPERTTFVPSDLDFAVVMEQLTSGGAILLEQWPEWQSKIVNGEERANLFVNFMTMTMSGLVAQDTWTAARAPQEDMYTRKEWDKHETLRILAVWTP